MNTADSETWLHWLTHDASGFFTAALVVVGAVQLVLFVWQLRLIRATVMRGITPKATPTVLASASAVASTDEPSAWARAIGGAIAPCERTT
jgi:hypothetical protein